ncbi:hypothetical protein [Tardiphaga sp. vice352]|uniref:hypothetical protein n=1 Tax=Tardiphaga sp. vice352 TaxID=2592816 RepID=UPI001FEFFFCD|nr:hypothetical protein [Tardiphaga sp. vice352]
MNLRYGKVTWGPHGERVRTAPANWRQPVKWNKEAAAAGRQSRLRPWAESARSRNGQPTSTRFGNLGPIECRCGEMFDRGIPEATMVHISHITGRAPGT